MKKNKNGVSDVVTTVLIVMLTVAAIGVIAGFVVPFVKNSLQKSTECTNYGGFYTFDESLESESFKSNCNTTGVYIFSIKSNNIGGKNDTQSNKILRENVNKIKFIFTRPDGTTNSTEVINGSASGFGGIARYGGGTIILPGPGGIETYNYTSGDEFVSAEVYPILKSGRICADVKESITIKDCE